MTAANISVEVYGDTRRGLARSELSIEEGRWLVAVLPPLVPYYEQQFDMSRPDDYATAYREQPGGLLTVLAAEWRVTVYRRGVLSPVVTRKLRDVPQLVHEIAMQLRKVA